MNSVTFGEWEFEFYAQVFRKMESSYHIIRITLERNTSLCHLFMTDARRMQYKCMNIEIKKTTKLGFSI